MSSFINAQEPIRKGMQVPDGILGPFSNNPNTKITIIDFFGTWCAPCLKALPHLAELKKNLAIV
ncbi:MAG: hypothetical protein K2X37_07570 [Chitinophagaceae bacterium]|nr:hypothetical protein [Chitinophagaceae bacterium]